MAAYLQNLNPTQQEAVINTEGPCMIIAGAGAGKTRILTYRITHLIKNKQISPFHILALTFTNKAAREMRERVEKMVGHDARNVWLGTFHSVFAKILRIEAHKLGYPANFSIYDSNDSKSLIKSIIKEIQLDDKIYKPNVVLSRISNAKNRLISAKEYANNPIYQADDERSQKPAMGKIFLKYAERCFKAGGMDFDDLLFNTHQLFSQHMDVLYQYQEKFQYILIDEFQDTNIAQYTIIKDLAATHKNICVVGDDSQSIYAFRGADIHNILNFEKDHPDLQMRKLEQNYRSTKNIVNAANAIIRHNKVQLPKAVWTDNATGEPLEMMRAGSDTEEGRLVADSIFEEKMNKHLSNNDFAVLYRTNSQSRSIEEALRKINIPYRIMGGMSFYQRKEVKDLLAYLRFTVNHNDEEALKRIINLPKRGIGPTTVDKIIVAAFDHDLALWEVMGHAQKFFSERIAHAIDGFVHMVKSFEITLAQKDAYETAHHIAQRSGLLRQLHEDKTVEGLSRYENTQELLNGIKNFVAHANQDNNSLGTFLQEVALVASIDEAEDQATEKVTLMTIHAAKGLEFAYVYIVGMEEDLFPSPMMLSSQADLEEERRLFYVAVTRAKHRVFCTYALSRYRFGRLKNCKLSRFIEEIDPAHFRISKRYTRNAPKFFQKNTGYAATFVRSIKNNYQHKNVKPPMYNNNLADFKPSDMKHLQKGMQVEHPKFGKGVVIELTKTDTTRKAKVNFSSFGEKTLLLSFAKLKIRDTNTKTPTI